MKYFIFDPSFGYSQLIQLLGFAGAIWAGITQLREQRKLQKENNADSLRVSIYQDITTNIKGSSPTGHAESLRLEIYYLEQKKSNRTNHAKEFKSNFRLEEFHKEFKKINKKLWDIASSIEQYEIASKYLPIFREIFIIALREYTEKYLLLLDILKITLDPIDQNNNSNKENIPENVIYEALNKKSEAYIEAAYDITAYLYDIQVELQNKLLGDLFDNKCPPRNPKKDELVLNSEIPEMLERAQAIIRKSHNDNLG